MAKATGILLACLIPCVLPLSVAAQCDKPAKVNATTVSSSSIKVTWQASAKALTYRVFRSTTSGFEASSSNEVKPGVNGASYTDTKLSPITTYYYRIEAVCSSDESSASKPSAAVSGTTLAASPATQTWSSLYTRALVGVEVAGGSSLATQPKAFLDFNLSTPFPFQRDPFRNSRQLDANRCVGALDALSQSLKSSSGGESKGPSPGQRDRIETACADYYLWLPASLRQRVDAIDDDNTVQEYEADAAAIRRQYTYDYSPIAKRAWFWLNPRITAAPSQVSSLLTTVATPNPSFNSLLKGNYNQIVQNFSTVGGIEVALLGPKHWVNLGAEARMGLWLIAGAGFQTPLSATSNNAQIFSIPIPASQALIDQLDQNGVDTKNLCTASGNPPTPAGCTDAVAFVPIERSRFYYQGFAGLRLKTYYFKYASGKTQLHGLCDNREPGELCPIFPGIFDISVGQNSAYTGGFLHGWLLRTEAFYPLPFYPALHLYFTSWINVTQGNRNQTPLLLNAAGSDVTVTSPGVQVVTLLPLNRDYYRIGAGLDLVQLIRSLTASSNKASASKK